MRRSLPVLNDAPDLLELVEIPIPCEVPWDSMPGDEQVRHCGQCKQSVYNVATLTRAEANRLLRARACVRIYRRPDHTVITSDCRERLRAARKRGLWIFAGALLIVLWAQICAQFVGMRGLRRLLGGGRATMGEPRPVPAEVAPAGPPPPTTGVPPLPPTVGEPRMGESAPPAKRRLMGKPALPPAERKGKIIIKGQRA